MNRKHYKTVSRLGLLLVLTLVVCLAWPSSTKAQGWPEKYEGVMLQGFYWDSFSESAWSKLERQADELSAFFSLIWVPQSGKASSDTSMGYDPLYYYNQTSSFGTEAQLKSMIQALKDKGTGVIADVVVNHRGNVSNWVDFPQETNPYDGQTYQMVSTDICADDDGGATKTWADKNGYSLSANNDEGEGWSGMRDLDHKSSNVQACVKAYCKYLLHYLGYTGFRYDMVKGFDAAHVADYNADAGVEYSVGEYWDGNTSTVWNWVSNCTSGGNIQSAAFDFPFRYTVRDAINNNNWTKLANTSLARNASYRRYAVTFIENHDTEYRSASAQQDPIKADTLAGNAYMLAMPGTPCVFFKHWLDCKADIKNMILARKAARLHNQSATTTKASATGRFVIETTGADGNKLYAAVGPTAAELSVPSGYTEILSGYHYRYFLSNSTETAWADVADGEFTDAFDVKLTAVSATSGAQLVYTTDGTTPTASNGTTVASGATINISTTTTLKVGVLAGGSVSESSVITRQYTKEDEEPFSPYEITIYVNGDNVGWTDYINFWTWGGDGTHTPSNTSWPGDKVSSTAVIGGKTWFCKTFTINSADDYVDFVFSYGSGSPQTVDVGGSSYGITETSFFEVSTEKSGAKYKVNNVTDTYATAITTATAQPQTDGAAIYDLGGRYRGHDATRLAKGIYVRAGKKFVVR